jgi:hypothetical protein
MWLQQGSNGDLFFRNLSRSPSGQVALSFHESTAMLNDASTIGISIARPDIDLASASKPCAEGGVAAWRIALSERAAAR